MSAQSWLAQSWSVRSRGVGRRASPRGHTRWWCLAVVVGVVVAGACGGDGDEGFDSLNPDRFATTVDPSTTTTNAVREGLARGGGEGGITVGSGQEHRVTEGNALVRCDGGGAVSILADAVSVTIIGRCDEVEILGSDTQVGIESVIELDIAGDRNTVIIAGSVRDIDVEGNENRVNHGAARPDIDDDGTDNDIGGL